MRRIVADGTVEWVAWDELTGVDVMTTVAGPMGEDVFFVLLGENENGCVVPQSAVEPDDFLRRFEALEGFDLETFIRAMGSTEEARFVCWRRTG